MDLKLLLYTVGAFLAGGILLAIAIGFTVAEGIISLWVTYCSEFDEITDWTSNIIHLNKKRLVCSKLYIPAATLLLFSAVGFSAICCECWESVCCPERRTQVTNKPISFGEFWSPFWNTTCTHIFDFVDITMDTSGQRPYILHVLTPVHSGLLVISMAANFLNLLSFSGGFETREGTNVCTFWSFFVLLQESSANHNVEAAGLVNEDSLSNNNREAELTYLP